MDATFISIHDVSPEARILYSSDSVVDILGYTPDELVNRSAWDFFPIDEVPHAQEFHQQRLSTDKAAVLAYCRVKGKGGEWIGCECVFSVVYDVMIVCTSIYRKTASSLRRSQEAPIVRRIFSSSPRDPRYHMLSHLSTKFTQSVKDQPHEPRAALFLNRFTRTLSIMYATSAIERITGIPADVMRGRSFYSCIAENCHSDAVKCLENAKANDSIAYLRFWFQDPRERDQPQPVDEDSDEEMTTEASEDTDGGDTAADDTATSGESRRSSKSAETAEQMEVDDSRGSSGDSTTPGDTHEGIFGHTLRAESSRSSMTRSDQRSPGFNEPIELEAVISCTSDGLVVCLRKAKPMVPRAGERTPSPAYQSGLFAAPWAMDPIVPPIEVRSASAPASLPSLREQEPIASPQRKSPPTTHDYMTSIREQAVFAWGIAGINGTVGYYGHGKPTGDSLPSNGLPMWEKDPRHTDGMEGHAKGEGIFSTTPPGEVPLSSQLFGDPGLDRPGEKKSPPRNWNGDDGAGSAVK